MRTWLAMIVHLFPNELKFFAGALSFFVPLQWSELWVIRCEPNQLAKFQSMAPNRELQVYDSSFEIPPTTKGVIIHYLDLEMARLTLKLHSNTPIFIQTWGGDTSPLLSSSELFGALTREYYFTQSALKALPIALGYPLYEARRIWNDRKWHQTLKSAMDKARYTSFLLGNTERTKILSRSTEKREFRISYGENVLSDVLQTGNPRNVLIGNSATATNQHLEALQILKKSKVEIETILIPLSYGDGEYADWITSKAKKVFGDAVICLREFLPYHEYLERINRCGLVVMNHARQQALGNIFWALSSGKQVFLNPGGVNYQHLSELDVLCHPLTSECLEKTKLNPVDIRSSIQTALTTSFHTSIEQRIAFFDRLFK